MCHSIYPPLTERGASAFLSASEIDRISLRPVDSVDLTIIVDNSIDILLPSEGPVQRPSLSVNWSERKQLIAEHGYSVLFRFHRNGETKSILYDAGLSPGTIVHNLDVLGIQLADLEGLVLSHGHADHHGGFEGLLRRYGKKKMPLVLHPDAWRERKVVFPSGNEIRMPPPGRKTLEDNDVQIVEKRGPSLLLSDSVLVTGQVERVTDFEKGFPLQYCRRNGGWELDPWIWDDQGVVCNVKGRGLVVASSCSHSGVINVLRNASRVAGVEKIHAFVGGLHLTGGLFEPIIPRTIDELVAIKPDVVVPGHCTGWKAAHQIARMMPEAYVQPSVGTQIHFG